MVTVERAADVLLLFTRSPSSALGVTEIATALSFSKAAVHRILTSLRNKGLVEMDPITHRYALGPGILNLGLTYLDRLDVRKMAIPELAQLSEATQETATLSVRTGWTRVYLDQVTPAREVIMSVQIGIPHPLHSGSSSKAFLAFLPESDIERYLARPLEAVTEATITDPNDLRKELAEIRRQGFASSSGERQAAAASAAAPLLDYRGVPVAVMSVCGPAERFEEERELCTGLLLDVTRRLSLRLGFRPGT